MPVEKHIAAKTQNESAKVILPVRDALEIVSGKWKVPIMISLSFGNKRFSEISKDIPGITDRMLSKELRYLEMNKLIKRTVYDTIEYAVTNYGKSLQRLIDELHNWGTKHRKKIMSNGK